MVLYTVRTLLTPSAPSSPRRTLTNGRESPLPASFSLSARPPLTPIRYECIDFATELESCGGCASTGEGADCTSIPNAMSVGCESGVCAGEWCIGHGTLGRRNQPYSTVRVLMIAQSTPAKPASLPTARRASLHDPVPAPSRPSHPIHLKRRDRIESDHIPAPSHHYPSLSRSSVLCFVSHKPLRPAWHRLPISRTLTLEYKQTTGSVRTVLPVSTLV